MDAGGITGATVANNVWTAATRVLTVRPFGDIGAQVQPVALAAAISCASAATTNIINFTGAGALTRVAILVTLSPTTTAAYQLELVVDGVANLTIPIQTAALGFLFRARALSSFVSGIGNTNDFISFDLPIQFATSLVVRINVTVAGGAGTLDAQAIWSHA